MLVYMGTSWLIKSLLLGCSIWKCSCLLQYSTCNLVNFTEFGEAPCSCLLQYSSCKNYMQSACCACDKMVSSVISYFYASWQWRLLSLEHCVVHVLFFPLLLFKHMATTIFAMDMPQRKWGLGANTKYLCSTITSRVITGAFSLNHEL